MEQCPSCGASNKGEKTCRRCKLDLGPLMAVEENARIHIQQAFDAFERQDSSEMLFHARRAFSLKKSKTAARLLAVAAVLNKDYDLAVSLWVRILSRDPA
jgi:hypothetical protein